MAGPLQSVDAVFVFCGVAEAKDRRCDSEPLLVALARHEEAGGLTRPATDTQPGKDERLPPRERRTKLRRTATRAPAPNWKGNATEIQTRDATLKALPTNADHDLPTPGGPACMYVLSHAFS